jgi:hypothetical protein
MAILKSVLFGDSTLIYLLPLLPEWGGGEVADFPVSTSQDLQLANQNGEVCVTYNVPSRFTNPQELARNMVNYVLGIFTSARYVIS